MERSFIPLYRRRPSPLHRARASAALIYLCGMVAFVFSVSQPLLLASAFLSVLAVTWLSGARHEMGGFWVPALGLFVLVTAINPIVSREGLTVLATGPTVPVFGALGITLEAVVYGALMAARLTIAVLAVGIFTVAVDPDRVLGLFRRVGFCSALTASLTTRLVPLIARDASRLGDAQRCRLDQPVNRPQQLRFRSRVLRALMVSSLDRGVDVAVALESRGFGTARPTAATPKPWSGEEIVFLLCGLGLVALAVAVVVSQVGTIRVYPTLGSAWSNEIAAVAVALAALALAPFVLFREKAIDV